MFETNTGTYSCFQGYFTIPYSKWYKYFQGEFRKT